MTQDSIIDNHQITRTARGKEIATQTIRTPVFSYIWLELIAAPPNRVPLDALTIRTYLTAAFQQFLGLTGSAISVDLLKVEDSECWIRIPREDLSAATAALGGWLGRGDNANEVGWRIRGSGNFLGSLVGRSSRENLWNK